MMTDPNPWVSHPDYPGLLRCWDATALRQAMLCPRRHWYKQVEGWRPKPKPGPQFNPHIDFGSMWHGCVEHYDRCRLQDMDPDEATDHAIALALKLTWDGDGPWGGVVMPLWTCTGVEQQKTRRKFLCDAAKDEWAGDCEVCPKCGRPTIHRRAYVPLNPIKNRLNLLRAVLAYCDEQAQSGLKPAVLEDGTPALEIRFDLDLALTCPDGRPYVLCGHLDRVTEFVGGGGSGVFPHERKTTGRGLTRGYWGDFAPNPQIDTYDWAAHRLYLGHEGVIVEAVQVLRDGVRLARSIVARGPENRAEWEREVEEHLLRFTDYAYAAGAMHLDGRFDPATAWPRNTAACPHASGGQPCEFRDVCAAAPSTRARMLEVGFEKAEPWNPMKEG